NHMPFISDQGHSIWRRITVIPFNVTIPKEKQDSQLKTKLLAEAPGIFTWLVEGCLAYQKEGLEPCNAVSVATETYKTDMDTLGQFLGEEVVDCAGHSLGSQTLYNAYTGWCESMNIRPLNQKNFGKRLE